MKVNFVTHALLRAAMPFCEKKVRKMGMFYWNDSYNYGGSYPERLAISKAAGSKLNETVVVEVADKSPAELAGLRVGDVIQQINGVSIYANNVPQDLLEDENTLVINRPGGVTATLQIVGEEVCDYPVELSEAHEINAYADGEKVIITEGMLDFLGEDLDYLRLVIGHEVAHNTHKHLEAKIQNTLGGMAIDLLILVASQGTVDTHGMFTDVGGMVFSKEFEHEADYVGTYIVARAGYDVSRAPDFWEKMTSRHGIVYSQTHPSSPKRSIALRKTIEEIEQKTNAGEPLMPEKNE